MVFFHKPSKILITTDLFWDYPGGAGIPFGTKLWKFGMDHIYLPFYNRCGRRARVKVHSCKCGCDLILSILS